MNLFIDYKCTGNDIVGAVTFGPSITTSYNYVLQDLYFHQNKFSFDSSCYAVVNQGLPKEGINACTSNILTDHSYELVW